MQHSAQRALHVRRPTTGQGSEMRRLTGCCCRPAQYVIAESTCSHRSVPWAHPLADQRKLRTHCTPHHTSYERANVAKSAFETIPYPSFSTICMLCAAERVKFCLVCVICPD